jgi:SlyX protein
VLAGGSSYRRAMSDTPDPAERIVELEIKLAYQDHVIRELDALVRAFGDRLDKVEREMKTLKDALRSPEVPLGPQNEPPPHY